MDLPRSSPKPRDSQAEQSNVPATPEKSKPRDFIKERAKATEQTPPHKEKPSKPRDTSLGKDPENSGENWQNLRKQLVDDKMERHIKNLGKIGELEAKITKHEETISEHLKKIDTLKQKEGKKWVVALAERKLKVFFHTGPCDHKKFLGMLEKIDSSEKLKEAHASIDNSYKDSAPVSEELDEAEKSLKKAVSRILKYDKVKIDTCEQHIGEQGNLIKNLTGVIDYLNKRQEPKPSSSTEATSPDKGTSNRKRSREPEAEQPLSTEDAPLNKRAKLGDTEDNT